MIQLWPLWGSFYHLMALISLGSEFPNLCFVSVGDNDAEIDLG